MGGAVVYSAVLGGVKLVTSDAHQGLVAAAGATLGGSWQRCRIQ